MRRLCPISVVVTLFPLGLPAQSPFVIDLSGTGATAAKEAVLFPFDSRSVPFRHGLELELVPARRYGGNPVLKKGGPGAPDSESVTYYGTVIEIGGELRMWYLGSGDAETTPLRVCYATSRDGFRWEKPALGLVEYGGNRENNVVDLDLGGKGMSCTVIHEPHERDLSRRFKLFAEVASPTIPNLGCVFFSSDGLSWTPSPRNPVTHTRIEPTGLVRRGDCYYVVGQNAGTDRAFQKRVLIALASYDFERWTDACVLGFRRDDVPPRLVLPEYNMGKQVHLGAGLWDRGNVILGLYGQWNGSRETSDRRKMRMGIGLVVSQDGMLYREPVPDFKLIDPHEENWSFANPSGDPPRLAQGQGLANVGDKTITWYGIWGPGGDSSVRAAYWRRDRLGFFSPTPRPLEGQTWVDEVKPHFISAPIRIPEAGARVFVNASGLSEHARLEVEILDEAFRPLAGYGAAESLAWSDDSAFRLPARWRGGEVVRGVEGPFRVRVNFEGLRLEDPRVYAVYVEPIAGDDG